MMIEIGNSDSPRKKVMQVRPMAGHQACLACTHVINREKPILCIQFPKITEDHTSHYPCFMCGEHNHTAEDGAVIHFAHLLEFDPSLAVFSCVEEGTQFQRAAAGLAWVQDYSEDD